MGTIQSLDCHSENLAVDFLLGTSFIDRLNRGRFPEESQAVSWHSGLVPIPTRQLVKCEQPVSDHRPSNIAFVQYKDVVQIPKHVLLQLYTKVRLKATTPISGLFLLETAQLPQQYSRLYVESIIIEMSNNRTYGL